MKKMHKNKKVDEIKFEMSISGISCDGTQSVFLKVFGKEIALRYFYDGIPKIYIRVDEKEKEISLKRDPVSFFAYPLMKIFEVSEETDKEMDEKKINVKFEILEKLSKDIGKTDYELIICFRPLLEYNPDNIRYIDVSFESLRKTDYKREVIFAHFIPNY